MYEINKTFFGEFLTEQRKRKGYTQKKLAEKLFVSDKAVSKWERGLSLPDVSLLMPLSELLEVSIVELLEGRKVNQNSEIKADYVEALVKKTLTFSLEETQEKKAQNRKKRAMFFGGWGLAAILESIAVIWYFVKVKYSGYSISILFMEPISLLFGVYFWLFMKERLPVYFDENKINFYSDGVFRINIPGVTLNNSNWPYLTAVLRKWALATMLLLPILALLVSIWNPEGWGGFAVQIIILIGYLAGMFVPLYAEALKH